MNIKLRDYQEGAIASLRMQFREGKKRVCLVAPTGAGKTTIAAAMIKSAVDRGGRVLFLAHRTELIDQCAARLDLFDVELGIIKAGTRRANRRAPVQVASVQTLVRRELPPATLVIIDEAHRTLGSSYLKLLAGYPSAVAVGLTATPIRLDGKGLGDVFEGLVEAARIEELVERRVLMRPKVYVPSSPDLDGVKRTGGDYNGRELAARMDRPRLVGDIVEHWLKLTPGRKTVVFASSVEHSLHVTEAFVAAGIKAAHLDGTTHADVRRKILADLTSGELTVVSNVGVLTEGWDCPSVEVCVLARPTLSLGLYLQMVGRVLRTDEGKTSAWVLDHAGCTLSHGLATEARAWSLDGRKKNPSTAMPLKNCPSCYAVNPSGAAVCAECGYAWERVASEGHKLIEVVEGRLIEYGLKLCPDCGATPDGEAETCEGCGFQFRVPHWLDRFRPRGAKPTQEEKEALYRFLKGLALRKGYARAKGWCAHKYKEVMGVWPVGVDDERPWPGDAEEDQAVLRHVPKSERFKGVMI